MKTKTLIKAYDEAVKKGETCFECEGMEFFTDYAKYVLEYAASRGAIEIDFEEDDF